MKYYIVSEDELFALSLSNCGSAEDWNKAEAACRAREVRFIGAADQGNSLMLWGEVKK